MSESKKRLTDLLGIQHPIIVAPMFLVSNKDMIISAVNNGCTAAIPALNFRTTEQLRQGLREIKAEAKGPFGVNLIVNKSNFRLKKDLKVCIEEGVDFYITSLGSPKAVIEAAHATGKLVFCDVVNSEYALKVQEIGADAVIAVNNRAGGHAGPTPLDILLEDLASNIEIPIISAGGVTKSDDIKRAMDLGAAGVSVGTIFIASDEAPVSEEYKKAMVDYGAEDIVMTTRLSGSPCTVIKTPYVAEAGLEPTFWEKLMKRNKRFKKFAKMILFLKGMKQLRKSAYGFSYQSVWCAGPAIEDVKSIRPMSEIIRDLTKGL